MTPLAAAVAAAAIDALVVGIVGDPVSLDPHRATDLVSAAIVGNVCEPLVRYSADGARPEPALATAWATRDARRWTFTLREGVRFHDGAPFDADAVLANLASIARVRAFPGRRRARGIPRGDDHPRPPQRRAAGHAFAAVLRHAEPAGDRARRRACPSAPGPSAWSR